MTRGAMSSSGERAGGSGRMAWGGERGFHHEERGLRHARRGGVRLSYALGAFSLGLGLALLGAPHRLARFIGVRHDRDTRAAMRAVGLREIASGAVVLARPGSAAPLWARVVGDVADVALLGAALRWKSRDGARTAAGIAAVLGVMSIDVIAARRVGGSATGGARTKHVEGPGQAIRAITINCAPEDAYRFWRDLENLPRFMGRIESVEVTGEGRSRWVAKGPRGGTLAWDAEIVEDRPNELIAWRSAEGGDIKTSGSVWFKAAPGRRGTEVRLDLRVEPPLGKLGKMVAGLLGEPGRQVASDLRHFKQLMEVGEIVLSDTSIHHGPHPARPAGESEEERAQRKARGRLNGRRQASMQATKEGTP